MTVKERMLGVIQGRKTDRVPFVQYDNIGGRNEDIWKVIGQESMGILVWTEVHKFVNSACHIKTENIIYEGKPAFQDTLVTPRGELRQIRVCVPGIKGVTHIQEYFIKRAEDYRVLKSYLKAITVVEDLAPIRQIWSYLGDNGLPHVWIGRTPFQQLWIQWVSMADLSSHLADDPDIAGETADLLGELLLQAAEVVYNAAEKVDIPYLVIGDNISAPLIGRERFDRYCVPYYQRVSNLMDRKDVPLIVHMDGDLKPLWEPIGTSGVRGLDSFSPPPDNDTSVKDAVTLWPEMRLLLNFPSSVHLADEKTIYAATMNILEQGGHTGRLQIQVSENPPPGVWKVSYPQIVKAIADFGNP
ncbi:MAG: uroporphyrinogen decarboxylase family protein [Spirochaetota bacterium]